MPDGNATPQLVQYRFVEHLGYKTHLRVQSKTASISGGDSRTFLTAVLKSVEAEKSGASYFFPLRINTKYTAGFAQPCSLRLKR